MRFLTALVAIVALSVPAATLASDVTSDRAQAAARASTIAARPTTAPTAHEKHEACACACMRAGDHGTTAQREPSRH